MKRILAFLIALLLASAASAAEAEPLRIAVIDTGISTAAVAADNLIPGENYILPQDDTQDKVGHGTAIAGILVGSKPAGLTGLCPGAVLVPLVWSSKDAAEQTVNGNTGTVARAIYAAVDDHACRIINISSASYSNTDSLRNAVAFAEQRDVLLVSCAGNNGTDAICYPGGYDTVLCVGALDETLTAPASFSQKNASVDLLAPGTNLRLTSISGKTIRSSGTSYSTAYVSGAAARLLTEHPALTARQLRQILCASATDVCAPGYDRESGWGILNSDEALKWAAEGRRFRDVTAEQWYFDAVRDISDRGLLRGVSQTAFAPNEPMTRAMVWTVLARLDGADTSGGETWYSAVQTWVVERGLSDGMSPDAWVTREQLAVMLYRYASGKGNDMSAEADLSGFTDYKQISGYAETAMGWAKVNGLISGKSSSILDPQGNARRCEAAAILHRFCEIAK